jgi:hypothetical protein
LATRSSIPVDLPISATGSSRALVLRVATAQRRYFFALSPRRDHIRSHVVVYASLARGHVPFSP